MYHLKLQPAPVGPEESCSRHVYFCWVHILEPVKNPQARAWHSEQYREQRGGEAGALPQPTQGCWEQAGSWFAYVSVCGFWYLCFKKPGFTFLCLALRMLYTLYTNVGSVYFNFSVVSDSLQPHRLQYARPPCPSPTPRACSNSCPSSQWCHPTISSSVVPFSSCLQFFPASGSFPTSQLFASGGQSIGVSASVLPMNIQDWSPVGWTGWISLQSKGPLRVFSNTTVKKH